MRSTVTIAFGTDEVSVNIPLSDPALSIEDARRWLDDQFIANECEPLRASGKVLTADKLLAVANAIGLQGFQSDDAMRLAFARAASAALSRPVIRVDVDALKVSY